MKTLAAGGVVVALVLAGCGGGGGGRLSKADFRSKANGICAKYNAKIKGVLGSVGNSPASLASGVEQAVGYIKKGTSELDALKPPTQYDASYKQFSKLNHEEIASAERLVTAAKAKNSKGINSALTQLGSQGHASDRLARRMGLNTCASG